MRVLRVVLRRFGQHAKDAVNNVGSLDLSRKALALGRPSDRRCGVPEIERIQMDLRMAR